MHLLDRPLRRLASTRLVAAATWPHGIDGYAGVLAPTWSLDGVRARVTSVRHQTADTVTLRLRPNGNWPGARAGQHVVLTVEVAGVRQQRCFSVASAEGAGDLELTCKVGPSSVVARHLRATAAVGDVLELSPPQGDFVLPRDLDPTTPILLVGAGSGITPVLSMFRTLAGMGHAGPVRFVHLARTTADVLHLADLEAAAAALPRAEVVVVVEDDPGTGAIDGTSDRTRHPKPPQGRVGVPDPGSGAADPVSWRAGRFTPDLLAPGAAWPGPATGGTRDRIRHPKPPQGRVAVPDPGPGAMPGGDEATPLAFVCGPAPFMAIVEEAWVAARGAAEAFRTERFAPPVAEPSGTATGTLRFERSGLEVANDGRPVLEQAEAAGLAPAHGCRMGICHTCVVPATAGCVRGEDGAVAAADGAPVRICVSAPAGDLTVDL